MSEFGGGLGTSFPTAYDTDAVAEVNSPNPGKTKPRAELFFDIFSALIAMQHNIGLNAQGSKANIGEFLAVEHNSNGTHNIPIVPMVKVYNSSGTSPALANATEMPLAFNAEEFDTDSIHDNITNNTRLTCKTAGKYTITGQAFISSNATGIRKVFIKKNGADISPASNHVQLGATASASIAWICQVSALLQLAVNDYIELIVYQESGISLNVDNNSIWFSMVRLSS